MKAYVVDKPNISFDGAGLLWDEFLPVVVINKEKFNEKNPSIDEPTSEDGLSLAKGLKIPAEDNYTYTIETSEDEITIPLMVKQGSAETYLDDDGIISVTVSKEMPDVNFSQTSFNTAYNKEIEVTITRDNPALEEEFELKIVAEDNVEDDIYDGELKDVLCGNIKISFKKKEVKFETLRIKVLDCRSNEVVPNARVKKIRLSGSCEIITDFNSQIFNKDIELANAEDKVKQSQQALDGLGFDTNKPSDKYGDKGRSSYNSYWRSRFPELVEAGIIEEITEGNPEEKMLDYIINEHNSNCTANANGFLELLIPKHLLNSATELEISFASAYVLTGEESYAKTHTYSIKEGNGTFTKFHGDDITNNELQIKLFKLKEIFKCVSPYTPFGPFYFGKTSLALYAHWNSLTSNGTVSADEKDILIAMSDNEGRLDSIQSYDSEILSLGAMQKTVNSSGEGEFPKQVSDFKTTSNQKYVELFESNGWFVDNNKLYFKSILNKEKLTGSELKDFIRADFCMLTEGKKIGCEPLENLLVAAESESFMNKQIVDFISRLNKVLALKPTGHSYPLSQYLHTKLGKASVLDHHVNRPAHVRLYFGEALKQFFNTKDNEVAEFNKDKTVDKHRSNISRNPNEWGLNHSNYETDILEIYGPLRGEALGSISAASAMTDASDRFTNLQEKL